METQKYTYPSGKTEVLYKDSCLLCNEDRGFVKKHRIGGTCRQCSGAITGKNNLGKEGPNKGKILSEDIKLKMSIAKKGKTPWNKGLKGVPDQVSAKMSAAKAGTSPRNKGIPMQYNQKIKLSCINQSIKINEFNGFRTPENKRQRIKFSSLNLHMQCFQRANFTCDVCNVKGKTLNAHHKKSWSFFPEERYNLDNLVCLCEPCHKNFHSKYGNGRTAPNTGEQYIEFKLNNSSSNLAPLPDFPKT